MEQVALGGLAVATPREASRTCYGGWVLFAQLAYCTSNLGRGLKILGCNGEQCGSVVDFVMSLLVAHLMGVLQGADQ